MPPIVSLGQLSPGATLLAPRVIQWLKCEKAVRSGFSTCSMEGQSTQLVVAGIRGRGMFWRGLSPSAYDHPKKVPL
jgi:hypothetical protein